MPNQLEGPLKTGQLGFGRRLERAAFSEQKSPIKAVETARNPPLVGHFPVYAHSDEQAHP